VRSGRCFINNSFLVFVFLYYTVPLSSSARRVVRPSESGVRYRRPGTLCYFFSRYLIIVAVLNRNDNNNNNNGSPGNKVVVQTVRV